MQTRIVFLENRIKKAQFLPYKTTLYKLERGLVTFYENSHLVQLILKVASVVSRHGDIQ